MENLVILVKNLYYPCDDEQAFTWKLVGSILYTLRYRASYCQTIIKDGVFLVR